MPEPDPNQESSTEDQKPDPYQAIEQLLEHGYSKNAATPSMPYGRKIFSRQELYNYTPV